MKQNQINYNLTFFYGNYFVYLLWGPNNTQVKETITNLPIVLEAVGKSILFLVKIQA